MGDTVLNDGSDSELEELVMQCLAAADPAAELDRRAAGRPRLREAAWALMQQVGRLEQLEPAGLGGAGDPRPEDPGTWPTIPDVALEELVGRGGQGFVFRARQTYLGRTVAVKVLAAEWRTPPFLERFRREARMLAGLQHPHIVGCHQAGLTERGDCFLVMEFLEGPNLRGWLDRHGRMPTTAALRLVRDLATALEHARQHGFVHRDVKPENVLLQPKSAPAADDPFPFVPKLADLGLARPLQKGGQFTMLTPVGAILGTPVTMAPEQFDAPERVDHRADIYGLGCVLHHALAGRPAFRGTAMTELVLQKAAMRGPSASVDIPDVPAATAALVARMLAYDPAERPPTYPALLAELDALLPGEPAPAVRRWLLPALAAAVVAAGIWAWAVQRPPHAAAGELVVAAPATVVEGELVHMTAALPAGTAPAAGATAVWGGSQTAGAKVQLQASAGGRYQFTVPRGTADSELVLVVTAVADTEYRREVRLRILPDPAVATLLPGSDQPLFGAGDLAMAQWSCKEPQYWAAEAQGGVLANPRRSRTEAAFVLPRGAFVLRGRIEPRFRYESAAAPRVPIAATGFRLLFAGDDAMALLVEPAAGGGGPFRATLCRQQRTVDGGWRTTAELGAAAGAWPDTDPLQFTLQWSGAQLDCAFGAAGAPASASARVDPARDWQVPWAPGLLELHADRGVAVFTDWVLAAPR